MGIIEPKTSFMEKVRTLPAFLPPFFIIVAIMGSIYLGWATPTEAAALGVLAVFIIAIVNKRVSLHMLHESFSSTVKTASMILLIMVAAFYLNYVISILGWPQKLTAWFLGFKLSPAATLWVIVIFYLILGCFIETLAMMITTIPLVVPVVTSIGYDPIWFGIFLVVLCEASLVTPPVGMNLYVVQGIRTDKGPMKDIIIGMLPFLAMMVVLLALLIYFPILALWLPGKMIG
jgi:tripartite ATP-independent transporter DctM subunit